MLSKMDTRSDIALPNPPALNAPLSFISNNPTSSLGMARAPIYIRTERYCLHSNTDMLPQSNQYHSLIINIYPKKAEQHTPPHQQQTKQASSSAIIKTGPQLRRQPKHKIRGKKRIGRGVDTPTYINICQQTMEHEGVDKPSKPSTKIANHGIVQFHDLCLILSSFTYSKRTGRIINYRICILEIMTSQTTPTWSEVTYSRQNEAVPLERWGHRLVQASSSQLLLFGGFGGENAQGKYLEDLWEFSLETYEWKQMSTTGQLPEKRSNYTIHYNEQDEQIILFGGGASNKIRFNTICKLDLKTKIWTKIQPNTAEDAPWERTYHSTEFAYPYLVLYGGQGVSNIDLDDCWAFNVKSNTWKKLEFVSNSSGPKRRRFHSTCLIDNRFYVIGGCKDNYELIGDMHRVDLTALFEQHQTSGFVWERLIDNNKHLERWGHTSDVYNNKIYIFAGRISTTADTNDIIVFNPSSNTLQCIKAKDKTAPKPRRRHASAMIGSSLLCFGGYNGKYLNDFYYITFASEKPTACKANIIFAQNNEDFAHKIKTYEKKIDATWSLSVKHQQEITKIATNKNILFKNEFFRLVHQYSECDGVILDLPSFCSLEMFRIIHQFMMQGDAILCKNRPLSYYFNLIASTEYFNCLELIPAVQHYLLALLNNENCQEILKKAVEFRLNFLKFKAGELFLKSVPAKKAQHSFDDDHGTSTNFASKHIELTQDSAHHHSLLQALGSVQRLLKFDIDQAQLRSKPSFFSRTAQQILKIFSQSQPPAEQKQYVEIESKRQIKKGCLSRIMAFWERLRGGFQQA